MLSDLSYGRFKITGTRCELKEDEKVKGHAFHREKFVVIRERISYSFSADGTLILL